MKQSLSIRKHWFDKDQDECCFGEMNLLVSELEAAGPLPLPLQLLRPTQSQVGQRQSQRKIDAQHSR
jgi:hypothetical protein